MREAENMGRRRVGETVKWRLEEREGKKRKTGTAKEDG